MIVPPEVLKSVAFACYRNKQGDFCYAGTVFFVLNFYNGKDGDGYYVTVTARHVIAEIYNNSGDGKVIIRYNLKNGDRKDLDTDYAQWRYHPSPINSVDVAVFDWSPSLDTSDITQTPLPMSITNDVISKGYVGIGDELFIVGLFANYAGNQLIEPILRVGNIAMFPKDKIRSKKFGDIEGYLIESRSIGGLSGSPVFVYHNEPYMTEENGGPLIHFERRYYLLGLVHGHYEADEDDSKQDSLNREKINMGIAIVIPAQKIIDAVNDPVIREPKDQERQRKKDASLHIFKE